MQPTRQNHLLIWQASLVLRCTPNGGVKGYPLHG
jgi:hypothetical protein